MLNHKNTLVGGTMVALMAIVGGCTEEVDPQPAQPQVQTPAATTTQETASDLANQGNSALGGAKNAASNIVQQAEQQSQEVANEIDDNY